MSLVIANEVITKCIVVGSGAWEISLCFCMDTRLNKGILDILVVCCRLVGLKVIVDTQKRAIVGPH